jgi:ATP-dependent Zn protease
MKIDLKSDKPIRLRVGAPERELRITAFHEAGHCVGAVVLGLTFLSIGVTMIPDENDLGNTWVFPPIGNDEETILKHLTYLLCGAAAEKILAGDENHPVLGVAGDIDLAEKFLRRLSDEDRKQVLRNRCYLDATSLLKANWRAVEAIVAKLVKRDHLLAREIESTVRAATKKTRKTFSSDSNHK